jgi:hypothetical protein
MKLEKTLINLRKNKNSFFNINEGYINYDLLKNNLLIFNPNLIPNKHLFKKTDIIIDSVRFDYRKVIFRDKHFNIYFFFNEIIFKNDFNFYYGITKNL